MMIGTAADAFPTGSSSGKADLGGRRNAESRLSFPKTCSRFMIPKIQSFDAKTGKMLGRVVI